MMTKPPSGTEATVDEEKPIAISRETKIGQVMTPAPYTIGSDQKLSLAHKVMREHGLRHLIVLRGGQLVGVLSQRDLYLVESLTGVDADIDVVSDAMSSEVFTVHPDDLLRDVARAMWLKKYGCAVVVGDGRLLGIYTSTDALRHLSEALT